MKNIVYAFFLFYRVALLGQSTDEKTYLNFDVVFRLQSIKPYAFGENSLSKSHSNKQLGIGFNLSLLEYNKFRFGTGMDFLSFKVTDISRAGNFEKSNYNSYYGLISYDFNYSKEVTLVAYGTIGEIEIKQRTKGERFAYQNGTEYKMGLFADYNLDRTVSFFIGANYSYSKLRIETTPEFKNYFGNAHQIQLSIGIKIN